MRLVAEPDVLVDLAELKAAGIRFRASIALDVLLLRPEPTPKWVEASRLSVEMNAASVERNVPTMR